MKKILYLSVWLSCMLLSCKKDEVEPVVDKEAPVITLLTPADPSQLVKGTLEIKANATDNNELSKVELYVDNQLLKTASTSPLEFSWDSKTVTDGMHDLKVVATDKDANASEATVKVEVLNVFMSFKVDADYLTPDESTKTYESWIFVSDNTGKTIAVSQLKAGETFKFPTPDGFSKEKKYTFTRLSYKMSKDFGFGENPQYNLYSYTDIGYGEYHFALDPADKPKTILGTFSVTINNFDYIPPAEFATTTRFSGAGLRGYSLSTSNSVLQAKLDLVKEGTKVIFYKPDGAGSFKYKMMNNVMLNQQIVFDQADISTVMNVNTIALPAEATYPYGAIRPVDKKGAYDTEFYLFGAQAPNESPFSLKIYYPGAAFPEYKTTLGYGDDEASYFYSQLSDMPPGAFKKITADLTSMAVQENKITVEISGVADVAIMNAYYNDEHENYNWNIYAPALSKGEWIIPQLPAELKTTYPALASKTLSFRSATLEEHTGLEKYSDLIQLTFQSSDFFESKVKETTSISKSMIEAGGRKHNQFDYFNLYNSVGSGYGRRPLKMNTKSGLINK